MAKDEQRKSTHTIRVLRTAQDVAAYKYGATVRFGRAASTAMNDRAVPEGRTTGAGLTSADRTDVPPTA